jgi:hypothetical protein
MSAISGTPRKRKRRTRGELANLDAALYLIVREHAPCTVRQVYYRAVVAYLCDKTESGYTLIQRRLLTMRREQRLPYGWIEDNARSFYGRRRYADLTTFALDASRSLYHYDYWAASPVSVELWVESDSIAGTLRDTVVDEWGLRLHVARGFSSETFLFNAGEDVQADGRETFVYVLSDFDPSGVSLAGDIAGKLPRFSRDVPVHVERIALSGDLVGAWQLPTHPLKKSDRRAARFRREHGSEACELEAVAPTVLRRLVSEAIGRHVSPDKIAAAKRDEQLQREALRKLPNFLRGGAA